MCVCDTVVTLVSLCLRCKQTCHATHWMNHCSHDGLQQVWALQRHTHTHTRIYTYLHAQAQMRKVYESTRPRIKHKGPLSDVLNRRGCIPKHKCTVINRLMSDTELRKSLQAAGLDLIPSIHTLSWSQRKGSAVFRSFCACGSFL